LSFSTLPDEFRDIERQLAGYRPKIIFDVGANTGQSCIPYALAYPQAKIYAFEPVPSSYQELIKNASSHNNIVVKNLALGSRSGLATMTAIGTSTGNSLKPQPKSGAPDTVDVRLEQGYLIAEEIGVSAISFLKIDTEGLDLDVLVGFEPFLTKIDFIQVEAAMNAYNTWHVPFRALEDFLREHDFLLFRFYEQTFEFGFGGLPVMRRTNPLFIRSGLVDLSGFSSKSS
jgi:FkbM family methyltransferase